MGGASSGGGRRCGVRPPSAGRGVSTRVPFSPQRLVRLGGAPGRRRLPVLRAASGNHRGAARAHGGAWLARVGVSSAPRGEGGESAQPAGSRSPAHSWKGSEPNRRPATSARRAGAQGRPAGAPGRSQGPGALPPPRRPEVILASDAALQPRERCPARGWLLGLPPGLPALANEQGGHCHPRGPGGWRGGRSSIP